MYESSPSMKKIIMAVLASAAMSHVVHASPESCKYAASDYYYSLALGAHSGELTRKLAMYGIDFNSYMMWSEHDKDGKEIVKQSVLDQCSKKPWSNFLSVYTAAVNLRMNY